MKDLTRGTIPQHEQESLAWAASLRDAANWLGVKYFFERQWIINLAYLDGFHDMAWSDYHRQPVMSRKSQNKYVANKIAEKYETAVSMIAGQTPGFSSRAGSHSFEDKLASRLATRYLASFWEQRKMHEKIDELVRWAAACGTAYLLNTTLKDPSTRQRVYLHPDTKAQIPGSALNDGQRMALEEAGLFVDYFANEPDLVVENPFSVVFDPDASTIENARFMIRQKMMAVEEIWEKFDVVVPTVSLPDGMTEFESRMVTMFGPNTAAIAAPLAKQTQSKGTAPRTAVEEYVSRPYVQRVAGGRFKEYPNGRYVVKAGGRVIIDDENPFYKAGFANGFNVTPFRWIPRLGSMYGKSFIEGMIGPQRAYNDVRRSMIENFQLAGGGKWMVPYGAKLQRDSISTLPGEVIEYNSLAGKPEHHLPATVDGAAVQALTATALTDLEDASGQHDVLNGRVPGQLRSAPGMELSKEADMIRLSPISTRLARCISDAGLNVCRTAAEIVSDDEFLEIVGPGHLAEIQQFRPAMLKGVRSIVVIPGSMIPRSRAMVMERVMGMVEIGAIDPSRSTADREILLRSIELNENDPELNNLTQQRSVAERENTMMSAPPDSPGFGVPKVNPYDDDIIHLQVHTELIMNPEFENLPPAQREIHMGHLYQHQQRLAAAQRAEEQRLLIAKGAPGPKGKPSPPRKAA